jgi:hypothetical protein
MAPILLAMQYFAVPTANSKSKLLFYLVTEVFAQSLSGFSRDEICDRVEDWEGTRSNTSLRTLGRSHKCRIIST